MTICAPINASRTVRLGVWLENKYKLAWVFPLVLGVGTLPITLTAIFTASVFYVLISGLLLLSGAILYLLSVYGHNNGIHSIRIERMHETYNQLSPAGKELAKPLLLKSYELAKCDGSAHQIVERSLALAQILDAERVAKRVNDDNSDLEIVEMVLAEQKKLLSSNWEKL